MRAELGGALRGVLTGKRRVGLLDGAKKEEGTGSENGNAEHFFVSMKQKNVLHCHFFFAMKQKNVL